MPEVYLVQYTDGNGVSLGCELTISNPPVNTIIWRMDGDILESNRLIQSDNHTVHTMMIDDVGNYTCEAVTALGIVSSNVIASRCRLSFLCFISLHISHFNVVLSS